MYRELRLTFDQNICYENARSALPLQIADPECVVEIKADDGISVDYIDKLLNNPIERFSKYCRGVISSYL